MKRIFVALCLLSCLFFPYSSAVNGQNPSWEVDLDNGYISTKPIIVEDQVFVRTSGFWTGEDRPHVYAFDMNNGEENWRFRNEKSTNHDMSPLLHVTAGSGACGNWSEMIITAWTDGRVIALDIDNGNPIWESQTEVVTWGITGAMALDGENVVVPTRQGLSRFCLSDGAQNLRVDLPQLGWRNGVTVTNDSYLIGNEEGILNIISKSGNVSNLTIGEGMIRHPPIQTEAGIITHLQTSQASEIYLDNQLLSEEGPSPAIPIKHNNDVFFSTSESTSFWNCELSCTLMGRTEFHANGEITVQITENNSTIWFPRNTPQGGWGYGLPGQELELFSTAHDTYTTAGIAFGGDGQMVLGNDAGVLIVFNPNQEHLNAEEQNEQETETTQSSFQVEPIHFLLVGLIIGMIVSVSKGNRELMAKLGLLALLVIAIMALPLVSNIWSQEVSQLGEAPGDWDDDWPDEWKGTQVVVFELQDGEVAIGGIEGYGNVEDLTKHAADELGIEIEEETYSLGDMIVSFNGQELDGWEFTVDGERVPLGMSEAEVGEDAVVRWSPA